MKGTFFHLNFSYYVSFSPCSSLEWRRGCAYFYLSHWSKSYLAIVKAKSRGMNKEYIVLLTYLSFISEGNSVTWEGFWLNEAYWTIGWKKNRAEVSSCRGAKKLKFHPHYTEFSVPVPILLFEYEPSRGDMKLPQPPIQITVRGARRKRESLQCKWETQNHAEHCGVKHPEK